MPLPPQVGRDPAISKICDVCGINVLQILVFVAFAELMSWNLLSCAVLGGLISWMCWFGGVLLPVTNRDALFVAHSRLNTLRSKRGEVVWLRSCAAARRTPFQKRERPRPLRKVLGQSLFKHPRAQQVPADVGGPLAHTLAGLERRNFELKVGGPYKLARVLRPSDPWYSWSPKRLRTRTWCGAEAILEHPLKELALRDVAESRDVLQDLPVGVSRVSEGILARATPELLSRSLSTQVPQRIPSVDALTLLNHESHIRRSL